MNSKRLPLEAVGINNWLVNLLRRDPERFKEFLTSHMRSVVRNIHTDVNKTVTDDELAVFLEAQQILGGMSAGELARLAEESLQIPESTRVSQIFGQQEFETRIATLENDIADLQGQLDRQKRDADERLAVQRFDTLALWQLMLEAVLTEQKDQHHDLVKAGKHDAHDLCDWCFINIKNHRTNKINGEQRVTRVILDIFYVRCDGQVFARQVTYQPITQEGINVTNGKLPQSAYLEIRRLVQVLVDEVRSAGVDDNWKNQGYLVGFIQPDLSSQDKAKFNRSASLTLFQVVEILNRSTVKYLELTEGKHKLVCANFIRSHHHQLALETWPDHPSSSFICMLRTLPFEVGGLVEPIRARSR